MMSVIPPKETHVDLKVLTQVIDTLPPELQVGLQGPLIQLNNVLNRKVKILKLVQSALGQLRLDMKYLVFDLEATRRERDEYKEKWENR